MSLETSARRRLQKSLKQEKADAEGLGRGWLDPGGGERGEVRQHAEPDWQHVDEIGKMLVAKVNEEARA